MSPRHKFFLVAIFLAALTFLSKPVANPIEAKLGVPGNNAVITSNFQLSGSVTDQASRPLPNSLVEVTDPTSSLTVTSAATNSNGNYSLLVAAGTYDIKVTPSSGSGFQSATSLNQTISADTVLDFALVPISVPVTTRFTVSGRVTDRAGNGVSNAVVFGQTSDANGNYSAQVTAGAARLLVFGGESLFLPQNIRFIGSSDLNVLQDTTLDFQIPSDPIYVHVQTSEGVPVVGSQVTAMGFFDSHVITNLTIPSTLGDLAVRVTNTDSGDRSTSTATTDVNGNAVLWVLPTSQANGGDLVTATAPVDSGLLEATRTTNSNSSITLVLNAPPPPATFVRISGRVTDRAGNGVSDANVFGQSTDPDGSYSATVTVGAHTLSVEGGQSPYLPQNIRISGRSTFNVLQDTTLDFQIPSEPINVHVQTSTGSPVSGSQVIASRFFISSFLDLITIPSTLGDLTARVTPTDSGAKSSWSATTDADGNAVLWVLPTSGGNSFDVVTVTAPPESGLLDASVSAQSDGSFTVTLNAPAPPPTFVTITGRVTDRAGNGVLGVTVFGQSTDADGRYSAQVEKGAARFLDLRSGDDTISAMLPNNIWLRSVDSLTFTNDTTLDIEIPSVAVKISVQDPAGKPVVGSEVSAHGGTDTVKPASTILTSLGPITMRVPQQNSPRATGETDLEGNVTLWLLATDFSSFSYFLETEPPAGTFLQSGGVSGVSAETDKSILISLQFVHAPPVTTATVTPSPGNDGEYSSPVSISLSATPFLGFSIAATYYSIDGGPTQTYSAPFTISDDGIHTLRYWSTDNVGIFEAANTLTVPIAQSTDLQISQHTVSTSVTNGQSFSYVLTVTNGGTRTATDVVVTDNLPDSMAFVSCEADHSGVCSGSGNSRTVMFPSLAAGESASISLGASMLCSTPNGTEVINVASVSSSTMDMNSTNNSAQLSVTSRMQLPTITAPANLSRSTGPGATACGVWISDSEIGAADVTGNCGMVSIARTGVPTGNLFPVGTTTITYTATDAAGSVVRATQMVNVLDTAPPTVTINGPNLMTIECHTSFTDPGGTATDNCNGNIPAIASGVVNVNVPGVYTITYTATDSSGNAAAPLTRIVTVRDTIGPTITLKNDVISLWPPNHQYQTIKVSDLVASVMDTCDPAVSLNSVAISKVTSDELENRNGGDGNTTNDIVIAADYKSVQLRAERDGGLNGRVYTITFLAADAEGNRTTVTARVVVPKSQKGGNAIDDGPHYTVYGKSN